jgi:hypothetical protein
MGVTFWGNFASRTLLVPFHWRGMCYVQSVQPGRVAVRARSWRNSARSFVGHHRPRDGNVDPPHTPLNQGLDSLRFFLADSSSVQSIPRAG